MADNSSDDGLKLPPISAFIQCMSLKNGLRNLAMQALCIEEALDVYMFTGKVVEGKSRRELQNRIDRLSEYGPETIIQSMAFCEWLFEQYPDQHKRNQSDQPPSDDGIPF